MVLRAQITPTEPIRTSISRFRMEPINLEDLLNVDKTGGLSTGDVPVYDTVTGTWIPSAPVAADIDGGSY